MGEYRLNVCMPIRDRTILTQKCIQSIYENSTQFNEINIYAFDNISELDGDRVDMMHSLLNKNLI